MHLTPHSLDPTASTGDESSAFGLHPIRDAVAPRSRMFPFLSSLILTTLITYGISTMRFSGPSFQVAHVGTPLARNTVTIALEEFPPRPGSRSPTTRRIGPAGPGGLGHREGTNTIDPRLLSVQTPIVSYPTETIDPDLIGPSPRADIAALSLNPTLPVQPGGNGFSRGTGRDPAFGKGGIWHLQESAVLPPKDKQGPIPDGRLVPIRRQEARHLYQRSDWTEELANVPVVVRVVIAEDGRVIQATVLSGPEEMRADVLWAARHWLFESLGKHGLRAPLQVDLIFHPRFAN
ncbi:MAG: hypothetical protein P4L11_00905 [Geothrix sp.]|nr:hypothetical protein [Geothrix sp.]